MGFPDHALGQVCIVYYCADGFAIAAQPDMTGTDVILSGKQKIALILSGQKNLCIAISLSSEIVGMLILGYVPPNGNQYES